MIKVKNIKPHMVSVSGILFKPGEIKVVEESDNLAYALKEGLLAKVGEPSKPAAPIKQETSIKSTVSKKKKVVEKKKQT